MRTAGYGVVLLLALAPGFGRGGEELDFKRLCEHPLDRVYKIRDEQGRRLSLLQWKIGARIYFVLKDSATGEILERITADSAVTVPTIYRDEEIQLMVKPEEKGKDGKVVPGVYEKSSRKVATQSEFTNYLRDGKMVVSIPNSALPGVLPDVTLGNVVYFGAHERAAGSLETLKDDPALGGFALQELLKPASPPPPAALAQAAAGKAPPVPAPAAAAPVKAPDEYTVFDSVGRNFAFYVWDMDGKWYFLLADGHTVKKKIVADSRVVVPGVYEERQRQQCMKGAGVDANGKIIPPVFVDDTHKAPVKFETTWYLGKPEQIQWMSNRKVMIGAELYSAVREPAEDYKSGHPVKGKEGDF